MTAAQNWPWPRWIAHRGGGYAAPENTLSGILLAAFSGLKMVEFDVKLSQDGIPFLLHDDTLDRTTNGTGKAADMPWKALSQLDAGSAFDPRFDEDTLPSLAEVATVLRDHGLAANVEIKPCAGREAETGRIVATACAQHFARAALPPLLSSFSEAALLAAQAAAPTLPRGLLLADWPDDWLARAQRVGATVLNVAHDHLTPDRIAAIHAAGLAVMAWTVNDAATANALLAAGVAGLCTDDLDLARG